MKNLETDTRKLKQKGIYGIRNIINNKLYIGSTFISFRKRFKDHERMSEKLNHHNIYLNRSLKKYGKDNFEFFIIEIIENQENIREKERFFIDILKTLSIEEGFNISNQTFCIPHNEETRQKIGKALKEK